MWHSNVDIQMFTHCHKLVITHTHTRTRVSGDVHGLEVPTLDDSKCESACGWQVAKWKHNFTKIHTFLRKQHRHSTSHTCSPHLQYSEASKCSHTQHSFKYIIQYIFPCHWLTDRNVSHNQHWDTHPVPSPEHKQWTYSAQGKHEPCWNQLC